jgi:hypothetical protein
MFLYAIRVQDLCDSNLWDLLGYYASEIPESQINNCHVHKHMIPFLGKARMRYKEQNMAMIHCRDCGKKISDRADFCPHCGARAGAISKGWVALLLAWFLGLFGAHRFYVRKTGSAITMLILSFTIVGLLVTGIWNLIDMIIIISGNFTDAQGNKIKF